MHGVLDLHKICVQTHDARRLYISKNCFNRHKMARRYVWQNVQKDCDIGIDRLP